MRKLFPYKQDEIDSLVSFKDLRIFENRENSKTMHEHGICGVFPSNISFELHNEYVKQFEIISITTFEDDIEIKVKPV